LYGRSSVAMSFFNSGGKFFQLVSRGVPAAFGLDGAAAQCAPDFAPPSLCFCDFSLEFEVGSTPLGRFSFLQALRLNAPHFVWHFQI
jgi:hypothetical protein